MSAGVAAPSADTGLSSTTGPVSGQINPGYSVSTGFEGASRPIDDMPESNLAAHFRCAISVQNGDVFKVLKN